MPPGPPKPQPRIIPACAGNTDSDDVRIAHDGDHPRVCGEHIAYRIEGASSQGSSPRVRGTHHHRNRKTRRPGIIPACAGNTAAGPGAST
ncbi:hypothetical protein BIFANG_03338 [Bifidobacterium angulatum DSM 20098 = JCM 7096]|nr:hypothetical protein BIFANG_03338 [Bifidobacterium angulatum DSM 20098 = JCM 7096]